MTLSMTLGDDALKNITHEEDCSFDIEKIIKLTSISLKNLSKAYYKPSTFLEFSDIDQIKNSLNNYLHSCLNTNEFKDKLLEDLTTFQNQIKTKHMQKINELVNKKRQTERQIRVLNYEKNKLIMERLYKIIWPYDKKTQEYTNQINKLTIQVEQYGRKLSELKSSRPFANEKDILLYQMHLKEKYLTQND